MSSITDNLRKELDSSGCKWWGYLHVNQTIHLKRLSDTRDVIEAVGSDFVEQVFQIPGDQHKVDAWLMLEDMVMEYHFKNRMKKTKSLKKPCVECPFNKKNNLPMEKALGGASVETYIGQIQGPFWLPCHMDKKYQGKDSNYHVVQQCAGAAIFRSNTGNDKMPEQLLNLPKDTEQVFSSFEEFASHYWDIPVDGMEFEKQDLFEMMVVEMSKAEVKKLT